MSQKIWRCQACYRVNAEHQANCEKCGDPRTPDLAKIDKQNSIIVYVFQAVFLLLALVGIHRFELGLFSSLLVLTTVWWSGLAMFAAQPVGCSFLNERRHAKSLIEAQHSDFARVMLICVFRTIYWPIFISKNVYFWSILSFVAAYYALKFFYGN